LARSQTPALPAAGIDSVNEHQLRKQFRGDLSTLIEDMTQSLENEDLDPYSKESKKTLLEHHTRILFFDRLLTILGWRLGTKDNVAEEARIKAETTRFMGYGITQLRALHFPCLHSRSH
jgi:hypothetical protein